MEFSGFASIYELFAGFNMAYAGSKKFSAHINGIATKSFLSVYERMETQLYSRYVQIVGSCTINDQEHDTSALVAQAAGIHTKYYGRIQQLKDESNRKTDFDDKFKSLYLVGSLYCLFILFMAGYSSEFTICNLCTINEFSNIVLLFYVLVFILTFYSRYTHISHGVTLVGFVCLLGMCVVLYYYHNRTGILVCDKGCIKGFKKFHFEFPDVAGIDSSRLIIKSVVVAVVPFFLHFIRVQLDNMFLTRKYIALGKEITKDFDPIEKEINIIRSSIESLSKYKKSKKT